MVWYDNWSMSVRETQKRESQMYTIFNTKTQTETGKTYKSYARARAARERMELAYGAAIYSIRRVDGIIC
jgi:hypothetical protein